MALMHTPVCDFGLQAPDFKLLGVDAKEWSLADCRGKNGLLVMFICNHCPYVKAIQGRLIKDIAMLFSLGIGVVGINANDAEQYEEDNYFNMQQTAKQFNYNFSYLIDETQVVAKQYGAICTPDLFGYNADLKLQYRGQFDDLVEAMRQIAKTGQGPKNQVSSMGCSIKWRYNSSSSST